VALALGNWGSEEAVPVLTRALHDAEPLVHSHAAWALGAIGSSEAVAALRVRAGMESDPLVLEELSTPLEGLERHLSSRMLPSNEPDE
jgi:hypothetical protein